MSARDLSNKGYADISMDQRLGNPHPYVTVPVDSPHVEDVWAFLADRLAAEPFEIGE